MKPRHSIFTPLSFLFLFGCGVGTPPPDVNPRAATPFADSLEAALWSREGLVSQSRMVQLRQHVPPESEYNPGTTPWRRASLEIPSELATAEAAHVPTPGAVLAHLVLMLGWNDTLGEEVWERTTRVWREDDGAVGVILQWGFKDDSVAGHDFRFNLSNSDRGWYVEDVEERFHCSRGVTADGLCV